MLLDDEGGPVARRRRGVALPASIFLHGVAVAAIVVIPLLLTESLPPASTGVRAFFVEPITAPAPPPPPPPLPSGPAAPSRAPKAEVKTAAFTAPVEVPTDLEPVEDSIDFGASGGVPGGVEGGVPGGVVGAIVTDLPDAPPPPAPVLPVRVGGNVREPRKVVDVPPVYPDVAVRARVEGVVIIEATIDERGRVRDTKVLRGLPLLDDAAVEAVRQWVYTPTLLDGVPTPIIMTVTVRFQLRGRDL